VSTLTPDTLETFPECPAYGFTVEPRYLVKAIERDGGSERVDRRWSRPLNFYTAVPMGDRAWEDAQNVLIFWHAVGGMAGQFRFKDFADFKSCRVSDTPTELDQPFEVLGGGGYQLVKRYVYGSLSQLREVYRPVGSTIVVANNGGVIQTDWTLDEATGILTPGGGFSGTPGSWGGEFDVYARFTTNLSLAITNLEIQNVNFTLRERRPNE
jgi:uncharacterized protein (TIGR02217 family)